MVPLGDMIKRWELGIRPGKKAEGITGSLFLIAYLIKPSSAFPHTRPAEPILKIV
jgi:hypothetical protein